MYQSVSAIGRYWAFSLMATAALTSNGCDRSTPLDERPVPSELPADAREAYRKLPMDGASNFRDIGGYRTDDGRTVRWGMLYRSDKLSDISPTDERYLDKLAIKRIVDFRSPVEREEEPSRIAPDSSIAVIHRPITVEAAEVDHIKNRIAASDVTREEMGQLLIDANRQMVEKYTPVYREWMQSLLNPDNYPTVFHCTAGKDRTGLAAALVLHALGVPQETIYHDYLLTNRYTSEHTEKMLTVIELSTLFKANSEAVRALFEVDRAYLQEAFTAMEEHYGSVDNYFKEGLGIGAEERQRLREILLMP